METGKDCLHIMSCKNDDDCELSVVVRVYNSSGTLRKCLEAIRVSDFNDYELIVIDDASTDSSADIAREYADKVVSHKCRKGLAASQNAAFAQASAGIIVNVDSDVIIPPYALSRIKHYLDQNPNRGALTGLLSKGRETGGFFTQYKNLYMNYTFSKLPERVSFLYGSLFAVRKGVLTNCDTTFRRATDTELGQQLFARGVPIGFSKELEVEHLKQYSMMSFFQNDFKVSFYWSRLFIGNRGWKQLGRGGTGFAHAGKGQLIAVITAPLAVMLCVLPWIGLSICVGTICIWGISSWPLLMFLLKERGLGFFLFAVPITFLDHLVMASGITLGFLSTIMKRRNNVV